jgi:hypothetical protein
VILAPAVARFMSVISLGMVFGGFRMILGWIDRRTGDPIMRERINKGSDKFFIDEEKNWGRSELDSVVRGDFDNV